MKTRFTPYLSSLIFDACLKSFWRKQTLSKFLSQCGIAEKFMTSWGPDETKRNFLDRLFTELLKTDHGREGLLRISTCLIEQKSFPDLENWEDSTQKIKAASLAIQKLRIYQA